MSCGGRGEEEEEEGYLDYDEEIADVRAGIRRASEEDEVKVHPAVDIEEGELSSGEEGEIKDVSGESSGPAHLATHPSPSPPPPTASDDRKMECDNSEERKEGREEEEGEEAVASDDEGKRKVESRSKSPARSRGAAVCRHFLQGKCSWGRECRFSHDDRALPRPARGHPPPHAVRGGGGVEPYLGPPNHPELMRSPPLGPVLPHHLAPPPPHPPPDPREIFLPFKEVARGSKVSQVEEESEGWYRLRTVARDWSSDEEKPALPANSGKKKKRKGDERARRESSGGSSPEAAGDKGGKKRKRKEHSPVAGRSGHGEKDSGSEEKASRRKKRKDSSSSESSEPQSSFHPHHHPQRPFHFPPGPLPPDRFFPHTAPFPPFGLPRPLPPHLNHRHLPFAPLPHYPDRYGQPPPFPDWCRETPIRAHHRDHSVSPKRRRRRKPSSSSPSAPSSPEHGSHGSSSRRRKKKRERTLEDKTLDRKEQLLQELSVINKVIERKKQRKSGRYD